MRKNKEIKKKLENALGIRLREYCEVLNPPEYGRNDFQDGETLSQVAASVGKSPDYILNEIRLKRLTATVSGGKVRVLTADFLKWLAMD